MEKKRTTDKQNPVGFDVPDPVILIIDDDPNNLAIVSEYLEDCDYTVLIAEDGKSGLKRADYAQPDLILLDIMMPGIDGYETCRRLKDMESTKNIPVIFMTALAETEQKVRGFETGAVDYVVKPFQREEVLARVGVHLRIRELTTGLQKANELLEKRVEKRTAEVRNSERRLADIINFLPDAIFAINLEGEIILWNRTAEEFTGAKAEEMLGKGNHEYSIPFYGVRRPLLIDLVLKPSAEIEKLYPYFRRDDGKVVGESYTRSMKHGEAYMLAIAAPLYDSEGTIIGAIESVRDITERKRAEESLKRLNRELRAISSCNQVLVRAEDEPTLLDDICRIICNEAGYHMAWVGYAENDGDRTIRPVAWAGVEDGYLATVNITWADTERGRGPAGRAIRTGESAFIQDFATDPQAAPWRENALRRGYRSCLALCLKDDRATPFGALIIYSTEPNVFTPDEIRLLEELAGDLAFGITVLRARIERKRAEEALKRSEERFRRLTENARDAIYRMSLPEGIFEYMSPAIFDLCGYRPEEFYGAPQLIRQIIHPEWHGYFEEQWARLLRGDMPTTYEFQIIHKSGVVCWVNQRNILVQDEGGRFIAIEGITTDITERKQAEAELRRLNEELEKRVAERTADLQRKSKELKESQMALMNIVEDLNEKTAELEQSNAKLQELDRLKSMFIASMSHELRTPLNSIIGFSSILCEEWLGPLNEEQRKNLETVLRAGRHLLALINDVIDVSKVEAGKMETSLEAFDLYDVMVETAELFSKEAGDKGLAFTVQPLHQKIRTDRRRLGQCLINLMSNAVKFTESGSVKTTALIVPGGGEGPGQAMVELTVEDTGIGIREEDLGKLFDAFVRLKTPSTVSIKGTGLGLYLTRKIVNELLEGEVGARSCLGKGSRFFLRIPVREEEEMNEKSARR